ncbi:DUF6082 family protein [Streptomyces sp. NPDC087440]|uniref:DUF6082 family protein n=1 Tax=Streptomyces sp. NPDC087440 TaxID=3365790 RepID=UPI0038048DD3
MIRTRTTSNVLLAAAVAVGAAHTVLSARDRRHQTYLTAARHHLALLTDAGSYGSHLMDGLDEDEQRKLLDNNAWVSFWAAQFKVGILSRAHLRTQADRFLDSEAGRDYWAWARSSWDQAPNGHYFRAVRVVFDEAAEARTPGLAA